MRSERLLSLILELADGKIHSAPEFALRFKVSLRSIYRDMELLSGMGLPIEAIAGREGGFRVLPGYTLDRSVLDRGELAAVAAALGGIGRITGDGKTGQAGSKLQALLARVPERQKTWIRIELGGGKRDKERIETLRQAIEEKRLILINYRDAEGAVTERRVEPAAVVYLWQSWYLYAYCRLREDWRLFKLARIESVQTLMAGFTARAEPSADAWREEWESRTPTRLKLLISPEAAARGDEWFETSLATPDGGRIVDVELPENDWLLGFLLSFGEGLRVLEPEGVARALAERARRIWLSYEVPIKP